MPSSKSAASFWGSPTCEPRDKDVAKFLGSIRELTKNQSDKRSLGLATSAVKAILHFIVHRFGPKEAMAIMDAMRKEITEVVQ